VIQPWLLLTNYQRYLDQFVAWELRELSTADGPYQRLALPGGNSVAHGDDPVARFAAAPWRRFQMPASHLLRRKGEDGVTIVNIGVGPTNAKNITPTWRCCVRIAGS
jgi:AMP nucleosidase